MSLQMPRSLLALALLSLGACSHPTTRTSPEPARGKPHAPVSITAELTGSAAQVAIRFDADATDVRVEAHGTDGLSVDGEAVLVQPRVSRDEVLRLPVGFRAPPGRSALVVSVAAHFGGVKRARVASFRVGEGLAPRPAGEVMTTDDGDTVRVLPAAQPSPAAHEAP